MSTIAVVSEAVGQITLPTPPTPHPLDGGSVSRPTSTLAEEREVFELRRAGSILTSASAFVIAESTVHERLIVFLDGLDRSPGSRRSALLRSGARADLPEHPLRHQHPARAPAPCGACT